MKYRADIDGLRALAVIPVVLFHSGVPFVQGGYVGVDVFFVISGYVITSGIQGDLEAGRFSILDFYERRIRRIVPALLFTMLLCLFLALVFFLPAAMADFSRSLLATAAFVSNFFFWRSSGYFDLSAQTRPLLHTWSLSVEEQFYVGIPLLLFLAWRLGGRAALPVALLAALSLGLSVFITHKAPSANFYLLPTRAWELLAGSLLVLLKAPPLASGASREALAAAGVAMIAYAVFGYSEATPFPGASALLPVGGAALLIYSGQGDSNRISAILASKPLVAIGLISYSLYLVHWPIAVFTRYYLLREPDAGHVILIVAASLTLAFFSWRYIEQPFRRPKNRAPRASLFAGTAAALGALCVIGATGVATDGFRLRFPGSQDEEVAASAQESWRAGVCFLANQPPEAWRGEQCMRTSGAAANALLWGDSFAAHYVPGLVRNADKLNANIIQYTSAGCPPILSYQSYAIVNCHEFNQRVFEVIKRFNVKTVILSTRWDLLRQRGFEGLRETIDKLAALGVDIYVIGQSPMFAFNPNVLAHRGAGVSPNGSAAWFITIDPAENDSIKALAGKATFIDPLSHLCRDDLCPYMHQRAPLYSDYGHFSDRGSDIAVRAYFPVYQRRN